MHQQSNQLVKKDSLKKAFLWLIVFDYILLGFFLTQLWSLSLNSGTMISMLLVIYNVLLTFLCFQRTNKQDSYIIYPIISATLLAFVCFLYFFFLV
ncbi:MULTISPECIES: hypothetical protein [Vibrio]|jgi:hypothetical protein|uniref:Uncharacterized protein n=1 Tax=Vibrio rotiferianus TaxID=190895 RepID=A0A2K7SZV3_9VIBR|nr:MULTISPECIES: hypothetical protein [Vibrio]NOH47829.1 hypothetical protein [Vibrio rotiferianus]OHY96099.1 hypothetical protein BI375_00890 [Vibrio rotiferianus]PIB13434.1 FliU potential lateral flagellar protein [Vibrio rotiferianus CAIM 577 = LMG 21460]TMX42516.1 hypothetical protein DA095_05415 [Vibrio rotiferianus]TMX43507.1 hypothetical protein DA093_25730 [Vibrio rotiferianus]